LIIKRLIREVKARWRSEVVPGLFSMDVDKRDNSGETALDIATKLKHTYAVELLKAGKH